MNRPSAFEAFAAHIEGMAKIFRLDTVADWALAHPDGSVADLLAFLKQEADDARSAMVDVEGRANGLPRDEVAAVALVDYRE